jgi:hypothetical protein
MTTNTLSQAVKLIKSGEKQAAAKILIQIVKNEPMNENAWLWLAYLVENEKRIYCLQKALEINPLNTKTRKALDKLQNAPIPTAASTPEPVQPAQPFTQYEEPEPVSPFEHMDQYEAEAQSAYPQYDNATGISTDGYYIPQGMDFRDTALQQPAQSQTDNPTPAQPQARKTFQRIELKANRTIMLTAWIFFVVFPGSYSYRSTISNPAIFFAIILFAMVFSTILVLLIYRLPHVKIILEENELVGPGTGFGRKVRIPYDDINLDKIKRSFGYGNHVIPSFDGDKIEVVGFNNEQLEYLIELIQQRQSDSYRYYR